MLTGRKGDVQVLGERGSEASTGGDSRWTPRPGACWSEQEAHPGRTWGTRLRSCMRLGPRRLPGSGKGHQKTSEVQPGRVARNHCVGKQTRFQQHTETSGFPLSKSRSTQITKGKSEP